MATEVIIYVDPDASGAGDGSSWSDAYISLHTAQNTEAKNLVTADEQYTFLCRSSSGSADATQVAFSTNWVGDSTTHYVRVKAESGDEAIKSGWDSSRYRLSVTDSPVLFWNLFASSYFYNFKIEGIQIELVYSSVTYNMAIRITGSMAANSIFDFISCRIRCDNSTNHAIRCYPTSTILLNIITSTICETVNNGISVSSDTSIVNIYNSVVTGCQYGIIVSGTTLTANVYNTASFNNNDDFNMTGSSITVDHCASDDGDGTNPVSPSGANWNNEFNDYSTCDFTLLSGGNLEYGGTNNPGSGLYSTDMEGDSYVSPWAIGIDEIKSAISIPVIMHHRQQQKAG